MKLKKLNLVFAIIVALLFVACVVHVSVVYSIMRQCSRDPMFFPQPYPYPPEYYYYAYPPEVAFLLIIPYAIAELITVTIWLIVRHKLRKKVDTPQINEFDN